MLETKEHIKAGDIFQLVLSQRFERRTFADPFEVYRALRVVNPSPYMVYMQARGCILVSSSPEILCRYVGCSAGLGCSMYPGRSMQAQPIMVPARAISPAYA